MARARPKSAASPRERFGKGAGVAWRSAFEHALFRVDVATAWERDGAEREYVVATGPDVAFAVPVWPDGTVTLNIQLRFGYAKPSVEVPGGHVDPGETPARAAIRELREETGIRAARVRPLLSCLLSAKVQQRVHIFVATGLRQGPPRREPGEDIETIRVPLSAAARTATRGWVQHGPSLLALLAAARDAERRAR